MSDAERRRRAEDRRRIAVLHKTRLHAVEKDLSPITGAAAVSLVAVLTRESWTATGRQMPEYSRSQVPIRFAPRGSA